MPKRTGEGHHKNHGVERVQLQASKNLRPTQIQGLEIEPLVDIESLGFSMPKPVALNLGRNESP